MIFNLKRLFLCLILFSSLNAVFAQFGFSHEIGVIAGPVAFQSDFGERRDFETNAGNTGMGIGLVHYISFSYGRNWKWDQRLAYYNDHFKLRSELSWNKTQLNHFGKWVDEARTSVNADRLRAHSGEANNFDVGMQLEFFPRSIFDFANGEYLFAPFVSLGVHYTWYSPQVLTTFGDNNINNPENFYSLWQPGSISDEKGNVWSMVGSVGVRYKLTEQSDLMLDLRWQYYGNDWVDGLNHQLPSNKSNDWLVWLNFGYIFYLN